LGRRNDLDICADILQAATTSIKKTAIVYQANLNFKVVEKYLRRLVGNGLLEPAEDRNFKTTKKGVQFLSQYNALVSPINERERPVIFSSRRSSARTFMFE